MIHEKKKSNEIFVTPHKMHASIAEAVGCGFKDNRFIVSGEEPQGNEERGH